MHHVSFPYLHRGVLEAHEYMASQKCSENV